MKLPEDLEKQCEFDGRGIKTYDLRHLALLYVQEYIDGIISDIVRGKMDCGMFDHKAKEIKKMVERIQFNEKGE